MPFLLTADLPRMLMLGRGGRTQQEVASSSSVMLTIHSIHVLFMIELQTAEVLLQSPCRVACSRSSCALHTARNSVPLHGLKEDSTKVTETSADPRSRSILVHVLRLRSDKLL
jgi:hypothetical protein